MSSATEVKPSWLTVLKTNIKSKTGNFTQSTVALVTGMLLAAVIGIPLSAASSDLAFATLGIIGFGIGAAAAVCRAYAHDVPERKLFDYLGKLLTIATLGFTGVTLAGKFPGNSLWMVTGISAALLVLLLCVSLVRFAWVRERKRLEAEAVSNASNAVDDEDDVEQNQAAESSQSEAPSTPTPSPR